MSRYLISLANSQAQRRPALIGYDWQGEDIFWESPANSPIRAAGICYWQDKLAVCGMGSVWTFGGRVEPIQWEPKNLTYAHSCHPLPSGHLGAVSTGTNEWILFDPDGGAYSRAIFPRTYQIVADAFHFNDFCQTPNGLVGSCFDVQPKDPDILWRDRPHQNVGCLVHLEEDSRVLACGLTCPHSLQWDQERERLWVLSSREGAVVEYRWKDSRYLEQLHFTCINTHEFLRGLLLEYPYMIYAGSSTREGGETRGVTLYKSKPRQKILASWPGHLLHWQEERKLFDDPAEVYDIIPWDAEIMSRAVPQIEALECE